VEGGVAVPRRTLEVAGKRKGELDNPQRSQWLMDAEHADERCTCNELPVWNAHQTNMAEKDTASLCDTELSYLVKKKEDG